MPRRRAITSAKGRARRAAELGHVPTPAAEPSAATTATAPPWLAFEYDIAALSAELQHVLEHITPAALQLPPADVPQLNLSDYSPHGAARIVHAYRGVAKSDVRAPVTPLELRGYHFSLTQGLSAPGVIDAPGCLRDHEIEIRNVTTHEVVYRAPPAGECPALLERLCGWINSRPPSFVAAVLAHCGVASIHAFGNGNGRTGRLLEFRLLLAAGFSGWVPLMLAHHYYSNRPEYDACLHTAQTGSGDVRPLLRFAAEGCSGWVASG